MKNKYSFLTNLSAVVLGCYAATASAAPNPASTDWVKSYVRTYVESIVGPMQVSLQALQTAVLALQTSMVETRTYINNTLLGRPADAPGGVVFMTYLDSSGNLVNLIAAPADEVGGPFTYANAQAACATRVPAGTWTLPNQAQMVALYSNRVAVNPSSSNGGFNGSETTTASLYWTNTAVVNPSIPNAVWAQSFAGGAMYASDPAGTLPVRCIRTQTI